MNILYLSSKKRWGGVVSWMVKTAAGLQKKGHNVYIISHPNSRLKKPANSELNIISKKLGSTFNPAMILYLIRFIRKNKIDLIVTNIDKEIGIGGIAALFCGIPNIRRVGREDDFNSRIRTRLTHKFLVDKCLVPCNYVIDASIKRSPWLKRSEFTTIYNGRNPGITNTTLISKQRSEWGIGIDEKIIGMTCQMTKVKHTEDLIIVFDNIHAEFPNWKLVITGEGPELSKLKQLAKDLSIDKKVVFPGFTSDPVFTASCYDIALSTSKMEGFPNTIVEYFSVGKPVVSTRVGGVDEIITHSKNGLLAEFGDLKSLENLLSELIKNEDMRRSLGENALITLKEKFTEDLMIDKLEKYFLEQERN